jgi:hypothetical protein
VVSAEQLVTVSDGVNGIICHLHCLVSAEQLVTVSDGVKGILCHLHSVVSAEQLVTLYLMVSREYFVTFTAWYQPNS